MAFSTNLYYEIASIYGSKCHFEEVLADDEVKTVDLYCGQFNPNVSVDPDDHHYMQRDIASDVRQLLEKKPAIKHMTVAVDCTIDYVNSQKIKQLLETFREEIQSGKLNFVFSKSGQKMDMFGVDNYFGSPYYIVNNGDPCWNAFKSVLDLPAHKTDALSTQWFCLANKYAADFQEAYRKAIFDNTRTILDHIPQAIQHDPTRPRPDICVSTAERKVDACFIDLKVFGDHPSEKALRIIGYLYQKCEERGIKVHSKQSWGFFHVNVDRITTGATFETIRINPGLNPEENAVLIEFFQDLAAGKF